MKRPKSYEGQDDSMLCKRVVTKDRRYITQITCYEKGKEGLPLTDRSSARQAMRMPLFGKQGGGVLSSLFSKIGRQGIFRYLPKPKPCLVKTLNGDKALVFSCLIFNPSFMIKLHFIISTL